jgi:hypothetical protein
VLRGAGCGASGGGDQAAVPAIARTAKEGQGQTAGQLHLRCFTFVVAFP